MPGFTKESWDELFGIPTQYPLDKQQWPELQAHVSLVVAAVNAAIPGSYVEVDMSS